MNKYILLTILIPFLNILNGCSSFKEKLIRIGDKNSAINNAIIDFSNTSKLYKKDNVFIVSVKNIGDNIIGISIGKSNMKILLKEETKIGTKGFIPSRYIEIDNKLFYWWDNEIPLTQDALDIFFKFKLTQSDENGTVLMADYTIDEREKSVHYFFCKNKLTKYKKVITNKGIGYYNAPNLDCGSQ
ncbi:hypothetical protein WFZ85_15795 [Flavobacterium sp. j3]|uniref:Lipoprotein n=1 Tax=Flavobacterium aureirubrum TaxID=3133147 RepID=A0ABU9NAX3_9FLAO